jgi:hypothetical protein
MRAIDEPRLVVEVRRAQQPQQKAVSVFRRCVSLPRASVYEKFPPTLRLSISRCVALSRRCGPRGCASTSRRPGRPPTVGPRRWAPYRRALGRRSARSTHDQLRRHRVAHVGELLDFGRRPGTRDHDLTELQRIRRELEVLRHRTGDDGDADRLRPVADAPSHHRHALSLHTCDEAEIVYRPASLVIVPRPSSGIVTAGTRTPSDIKRPVTVAAC